MGFVTTSFSNERVQLIDGEINEQLPGWFVELSRKTSKNVEQVSNFLLCRGHASYMELNLTELKKTDWFKTLKKAYQ